MRGLEPHAQPLLDVTCKVIAILKAGHPKRWENVRLGDMAGHNEPDYPSGVTAPPSRYKTGYGSEPYVITPPWSTLTAYDLNTGKIKWQPPYGALPQAGPTDYARS